MLCFVTHVITINSRIKVVVDLFVDDCASQTCLTLFVFVTMILKRSNSLSSNFSRLRRETTLLKLATCIKVHTVILTGSELNMIDSVKTR